MNQAGMRNSVLLLCVCCLMMVAVSSAQQSVTTHHNDNARTGQNLNESTLNTSNVNVNQFGKLFSCTVDGQIYAQPLYVPQVAIASGTHNMLYVATENNSVYAFDADTGAQLGHISLGTPVPSTDESSSYKDMTPTIGITATPVIDTTSSTMYVVAKTKDTSNNSYHYKLHALDITSGTEKYGGPVEITATAPGTTTTFNALYQLNRPGLLLVGGVVYLGFGSVGDYSVWHGWVLGYNATTLIQSYVYNTTPTGSGGGIWGAGQGLASDGSNIYVMTGNGTFDQNTGGSDYGDSVLKLSSTLSVQDFFTPDNQGTLGANDIDLGSGGPMLLPGTSLLVGIGKDGMMRVINTGAMGHYSTSSNDDVQEFQVTTANMNGNPIYWNNSNSGPLMYIWPPGGSLKAYKFANGTFQTTPVSQSTITIPSGVSNPAPMSLSANGSTSGTGIVWAAAPYSGSANQSIVAGILRAFDATDLTKELWDSKQNATRDDFGNYAKFCPPTVVNGKVYQATFSNQLVVYGLLPTSNPAPTVTSVSPTSGTTGGGTSVTINGSGFLSGAAASFGGVAAAGVTVTSSNVLTAVTPAHAAGTVSVSVTNSDGQSGTLSSAYTYVTASTAPTISSVSPNNGSSGGGTPVKITGTGFASGATVFFGGNAATNVTVSSSTSISATTPPGMGTVTVTVTNPNGASGTLANGFTYKKKNH